MLDDEVLEAERAFDDEEARGPATVEHDGLATHRRQSNGPAGRHRERLRLIGTVNPEHGSSTSPPASTRCRIADSVQAGGSVVVVGLPGPVVVVVVLDGPVVVGSVVVGTVVVVVAT